MSASTLHNLVPLLDGANSWHKWETAMQSYLESQGYWRHMQKGAPEEVTVATSDDGYAAAVAAYENKLEKWEDANAKAKGCIKLRLHPNIIPR